VLWAGAVGRGAGNALMMLRALGRGGCARGCSGRWGLRGASQGAAVRADNQIEAAGAASLGPSLGRMMQLTSLDLSCTLRAIGGSYAVSGCFRTPAVHGCCVLWAGAVGRGAGNALMMLRALGRGGCARGCSGRWGLRGASQGAAVRADNGIKAAGAASLGPSLGRMTQLTRLDLGGTLRASAVLVL
jgi:hypothetical protein